MARTTDQTEDLKLSHRKGDRPITVPLPPGFTLLQVTPRLEAGGVEQATLDIAAAAAAAGACSLVASAGGRLADALNAGGARLVRLPVHRRDPLSLWANARRLERLIRQERVSLVHVRSRAPAFSAIAAARRAGVPVVATYHGIYSARSPLKRWYNAVMTRADITIANSAFTRDHVLAEHRLEPARIAVVPEGIDTIRFDPASVDPDRVTRARLALGLEAEDAGPVLLLAARLTGWKGQGVMIRALARLEAPRPRLVLAGRAQSAAEEARLRSLAREVGVADRVLFAGEVEDMPAAYLAADLVVAPSTLPESFGRSVAEAAAMGRPVLTSALGAPAETVAPGVTGWRVPAGAPEAWAAATEQALAMNPEARAAMGAAGRARIVEGWSLAAAADATFAVYRRLLEDRA